MMPPVTEKANYAKLRAECERVLDWPTEKTYREKPSELTLVAAAILDALDNGEVGEAYRLVAGLADKR